MSDGITEIGVKLGLVNTLVNLTKNVCGLLKRKQKTKVYPERQQIIFKPFHTAAKTRYLICGISLIDLPNYILRDIFEKRRKNEQGGKGFEFRIILPDYKNTTAPSYIQLQEYIKRTDQTYVDLLKRCEEVHQKAEGILKEKLGKGNIREHLRLYEGILFQNITIIDNDAFISFYDASGDGTKNITIHCNAAKDKDLMARIVQLFDDIWKASK